MKGFRVKGLATSKIATFIFVLLSFLYPIPYTLYPTFAQSPSPGPVDIGKNFGFGDITSLGEGTSRLVVPLFSVATFLVTLYFLLGAFKYLRAGGSKEDVEAARQMIIHAIIGFFLLMLSFLILQFLLSSLFGITTFQIIKP